MVTIRDKIETSLVQYLEKPYRTWPSKVYLGEEECLELDKFYGGIMQEIFHIEIIMVLKRNYLEMGD